MEPSDIPSSTPPHDELTFDTVPNRLTILRIAFVPLVVGLLFFRDPYWDLAAAAAFGLAAITDYFDGYVARTRKLVTIYGKLMDPLADKFLVVCTLIALQHLGRIHPVVVMVLVCRELGITGLRALASAEGVIIAASSGGKWKTALQMVAIPLVMIKEPWGGIPFFELGLASVYLSIALSLWSALDYVIDFFRGITEKRRQKKLQKTNSHSST
jgi:CDP-diacylglycerol--glycerol-3-phosphate 3-phosphatidyltransferase